MAAEGGGEVAGAMGDEGAGDGGEGMPRGDGGGAAGGRVERGFGNPTPPQRAIALRCCSGC